MAKRVDTRWHVVFFARTFSASPVDTQAKLLFELVISIYLFPALTRNVNRIAYQSVDSLINVARDHSRGCNPSLKLLGQSE